MRAGVYEYFIFPVRYDEMTFPWQNSLWIDITKGQNKIHLKSDVFYFRKGHPS